MTLDVDDIPGTLESYLSGRLSDGEVTVSDLERHTEGWSRQTMSFSAESADGDVNRLVARVEPSGQERELDYRNDVETEFETMRAVAEAAVDVPMPEPYWYEADEGILGGPFFLVGFRPGEAPVTWNPRDRHELYDAWDAEGKPLPNQFVDIAVEIHSLGPEDVPALEVREPAEVVRENLEFQERVYEESKLIDEPAVNEIIDWLYENRPEVPETTLVHGDFRVGNVLFEDDEITAVLDWELSEIGDPLFDLAYSSLQYFAGKLVDPIERPNLAGSLLDREWYLAEYERRSGRTVDPERFRYWRVYGAFRMMNGGVGGAGRFDAGETEDVRSAWFQYIVPGLIEDMLDLIEDDRT